MSKVVIIMGSKTDLDHCKKIEEVIKDFGVNCELRVSSAHKTPLKVLEIITKNKNENVVFITVAGMSNALSGFVDANTSLPVISCPPYSEKFSGIDFFFFENTIWCCSNDSFRTKICCNRCNKNSCVK